jgi:hypothetical protein
MDSRLGVTNYRKEALVAAKKRSVKLSLKQASVIAEWSKARNQLQGQMQQLDAWMQTYIQGIRHSAKDDIPDEMSEFTVDVPARRIEFTAPVAEDTPPGPNPQPKE